MEQFRTNRGKTAGIVTALLAALAVIAIILIVTAGGEDVPDDTDTNGDTIEEWQTFESAEYGFSLEYPADWNIATSSSEETIEPRFVFFEPPVVGNSDRPYDHFVNDTYVGVYPEGIATEGLLGTRGPITEDLPTLNITQDSVEYELEGGTPFAWFLRFTNAPASWGEAGYVWGRATIENLETVCVQDGEEVSMNACDIPMEEGAEIVRRGDIDSEDWQTVRRIIESITFNQ